MLADLILYESFFQESLIQQSTRSTSNARQGRVQPVSLHWLPWLQGDVIFQWPNEIEAILRIGKKVKGKGNKGSMFEELCEEKFEVNYQVH